MDILKKNNEMFVLMLQHTAQTISLLTTSKLLLLIRYYEEKTDII